MAFRSIQDRWYVTDPATGKRVPSARYGQGMRYRARYKDAAGKEVTRAFADKEKSKAQRWLDEVTASQVTAPTSTPRPPGRFGRRRCTSPDHRGVRADAAVGGSLVDGEAQSRRPD